MDKLIFGDIHGRPLSGFSRLLEEYSPETLICLCDFDYPKTIKDFMDIESSLLSKGKKVIKVPGNHEQMLLHNIDTMSSTLLEQRMTIGYLHQKLQKMPEVNSWLESLLNIRGGVDISTDYGTWSVIHGAYDGHNYDSNEYENDLWTRVVTLDDYMKNFDAMRKRGVSVMIRGHDHKPAYAYQNEDGSIVIENNITHGDTFELSTARIHTINPGAFYHGFVASISDVESKHPILKYLKLPSYF